VVVALSFGTRLGPYEVLGPIGAGGMGEVYRARDTRLGRDVAVKVLPAELSHDAQRLHRFEQEARLAGSLNHPNVLTVYDVGSHEGAPYLVTELLEGRSLRAVLASGPLPIRKTVEFAQQIAQGLAAAHARNIVHRDLKPANVFVTGDSRVKILDFGLAKLTHRDDAGAGVSGLPTETAERQVVGTVGYMAPEQVRGQAADARSDIFAFGAVLYEMLTGERAFHGETAADTLTAILAKDPEEISRPGRPVPPSLDRLVRCCLEKDPEERFQSARDVAFAVEVESGTSRPELEALAAAPRRRRRLWTGAAILAVLAAGAGGGLVAGRRLWETPPPRITQLTFRRGVVDRARFTPDGQTVVYSAFWDGNPPEIFTTRVESPESRSLGLPPARLMSVSSRGELAILLMRPGDLSDGPGTLARVPLLGGEPRKLVEDVLAADWSPDGRELAVIRRVEGDWQLEYPIGKVLARPVAGTHLRVSPRGDRVALRDNFGVYVYHQSGKKITLNTPQWCWGLAWAGNEALWVTAGPPKLGQPLWVATLGGRGREVYRIPGSLLLQDASPDGRVLAHHGFERQGVRARGPGETHERELGVFNVSWLAGLAADGRQALLTEGGSTAATAYLRSTGGGPPVRLSEDAGWALSPEGRWALIVRLSDQYSPALILTPTGPGEPRVLSAGRFESVQTAWFPDEAHVVVDAAEPEHRSRAFLVDVSGGAPRPITPEGVVSVRDSYRNGSVIGVALDGTLARYRVEGGEPQRLVSRLPPGAVPVSASGDGRSLFISHPGVPLVIERLAVDTGRVTAWKVLRPDDLTGVILLGTPHLTPDGEAYAYSYGRFFQDLFLIEGLRF
jgi:hypothetical protein